MKKVNYRRIPLRMLDIPWERPHLRRVDAGWSCHTPSWRADKNDRVGVGLTAVDAYVDWARDSGFPLPSFNLGK